MAEQKMLTSEGQKREAVQGAMATFEQHYQMKLTEQETSRVLDRALENLKSSATPREVKGAVRNQMFALLAKKDPGRAAEVKKEKGGKPAEKKGKK